MSISAIAISQLLIQPLVAMVRYKFTKAEYAFYTLFDRQMKASRPNEFNDVFEFCPISDPNSFLQHALREVRSDPSQLCQIYGVEVENGYAGTIEQFKEHVLAEKMAGIRSVIYGAQIDPSHKRRIEIVLRHSDFSHIVCFQVECDPRRYLLRFKRLP